MSINIECSPFAFFGRFFQFSSPPKLLCHKTKFSWNNEEASFGVNGKQWQSDLGGSDDWKNHPTHENGESSMLIDMNGDGLPDRVFNKNPSNDQLGFYVFLNTGNGFDSGKQWQSNLGGP
jgi:hypothetical protein